MAQKKKRGMGSASKATRERVAKMGGSASNSTSSSMASGAAGRTMAAKRGGQHS